MTRKEICEAHSKNREKLGKAITQLERALNSAIGSKDENLQYALIRVIVILRMAWLESSLSCILNAKNVLTDNQVNHIKESQNEIARWKTLCEFLFRLHYFGGKQKSMNRASLGVTTFSRYTSLMEILETRISPLIELRNKLAHGQWHVAFNNTGSDKNSEMTSTIWKFSKGEIIQLRSITTRVIHIFALLTVSKSEFEKKFDSIFMKLDLAVSLMNERHAESLASIQRSVEFRKNNGIR